MKESEIRRRAKEFAIRIIETCDEVDMRKGREVLVKQIIRSATSIGANIHEANYGASKADFINKLKIALKECFETEYWLDIMYSTSCISQTVSEELLLLCGVIRRMLIKSIQTAQENI